MTPSTLLLVFRIFTTICLSCLLFSCSKPSIDIPVRDQGTQRPKENMPQKVIDQYYAFPENDTLSITGYFSNDFRFDYRELSAGPFVFGSYRNSEGYQNQLRKVAQNVYKKIVTADISLTIWMLTDNYITFTMHSVFGFEPFTVSWRMSDLEF